MRIFYLVLFLFSQSFSSSLEESLNVDTNITLDTNKEKVSKQVLFKKPEEYHVQNIDFNTFASNSLGKLLNLSSHDKTESNIDFNALNINIKNINSLLDYENSSLLLEKQAKISELEQAYSIGLINRYEFDNLKFGFNFFNDQYKETYAKKSFGTELQFSSLFKAYANYYDIKENDTDDSTEVGIMFDLPYFRVLNINTNIKETQKQYNITYSPFSILDLSLNYQDEKISKDQTAMWVKFKLSYEQNLIKQIYNGWYQPNHINQFDRYDFATRNY